MLDEKDFITLVRENQGIIHKICFLYEEDREARNDLFQDVVLQLWKSRKTFRGEAKATTWMYRVALNTAISGVRKKSRRPSLEYLDQRHDNLADVQPENREEKTRMLYEAIRTLAPVDKAMIMMALDELSYDEIASTIGITPNNVRVRMNRIRERLRKKLKTP